jgi:hypothetical protein
MFRYKDAGTLYVFTAIFSPNELNPNIIHEWQKYDETKKEWVTVNTVLLPIVGGRDDGYRTFSFKENPESGRWRVNVKTETEQLVGRVGVGVEKTNLAPKLFTETLN